MRSLLTGLVSLVLLSALGLPLAAQEFRVYTRIFNERADAAARKAGKQPSPVSRTTTVFHAGKVYDFIDAGERMTVYESAQERFLIFDGARQLRTEIKTSEIAKSPSNKLIQGDWPWWADRDKGDAASQWHNYKNDYRFNVLFGDGHTAFFRFPKEASQWNYSGPAPDPNYAWW